MVDIIDTLSKSFESLTKTKITDVILYFDHAHALPSFSCNRLYICDQFGGEQHGVRLCWQHS